MGHLLGYARVSTAEQDPALQRDPLTAAGCAWLWIDVAAGSRDDRPQLAAVLEQLLPGDTLVVWRLDRLGSSVRHLIDTMTAAMSAASASGRCRRRSTPRRPAAGWCSTFSGRLPLASAT